MWEHEETDCASGEGRVEKQWKGNLDRDSHYVFREKPDARESPSNP